jgi:hypothetical protein
MAETIHKAESRRDELMRRGILNQMPLNVIDISNVLYEIQLQFCRPDTTVVDLSDP